MILILDDDKDDSDTITHKRLLALSSKFEKRKA